MKNLKQKELTYKTDKIAQLPDEEVKKLLTQHENQYIKKHTVWIRFNEGNTQVGFDTYDTITETSMCRLIKLFELMDIEYSINIPYFNNNKPFYISFEGEDNTRVEYIQKFIDDGYKLKWE